MRFSPQILDEIRARLPVSQVVARKVALKKKGREYAGLSPFKTEKTPSFFVNDQKGFYHCFASGEHGDIFTFLIKTEGVSFPEAVERLAAEAGVTLPKEPHYNPQRENQRQRLYDLVAAAGEFFQRALYAANARHAREYLERRRLDDGAIRTFQLGYAPNSRTALSEELSKQGFSQQEMIAAGLLIAGDDIPRPYDRFRDRVIFPIHDGKGRMVAFGGRALDPAQPAKYLNSPETPLFHKGALLYNAHRARGPAFETGELVVVEGYMDAIAMHGAGFAGTVAPLGTALTENQLQLMWRMTPEPILCLDGDEAGRKAAYRAIDTALSILAPGRSLRFVFLSDGADPDDLLREHGSAAMRTVLEGARSLVDVLWEREWSAGDWSTPERRAGLEANLRKLVNMVRDESVQSHYRQILRQRLDSAWGGAKSRTSGRTSHSSSQGSRNGYRADRRDGGFRRAGGPASHRPVERTRSLTQSSLVANHSESSLQREALIVRTMLNHPWLIEEYAEVIADLPFTNAALRRLRDGLLSLLAEERDLDSGTIRHQLEQLRLNREVELVERIATHRGDRFADMAADKIEVEAGWKHILELQKQHILRNQLAVAEDEYRSYGTDDAMNRIIEIQRLIAGSSASEALFDD